MNGKRRFHSLEPKYVFISHLRNDLPEEDDPNKKKKHVNITKVHESIRSVTVALIVTDGKIAHGFARCEWKYQFNRKLARDVAVGRAKKAAVHGPSDGWWIHGVKETDISEILENTKQAHETLKKYAIYLLGKLYYRAEVYPGKIVEVGQEVSEK